MNKAIIREAALYHLTPKEIIKACDVNNQVKDALCNDQSFWKTIYRRDYSSFLEKEDYRQAYIDTYNHIKTLDGQIFWQVQENLAGNGFDRLLNYSKYKDYILIGASRGGQELIFDNAIKLGAVPDR